MKCFYHADADGKCAGFWVHLSVVLHDDMPDRMPNNEFIEINYGKPFPFDQIRPQEQVYIVDYSIEPDEMIRLLAITNDVTWIDHHKTAIEKYADFPHEIRGVRFDGVAGCMLTYCYIHHMTTRGDGDIKPFDMSMTEDAPFFTKLIADWDVWKFAYGDSTRYFHTAFEAYDFNPGSDAWNMFLTGWEKEQIEDGGLIEQGKIMARFRDGWSETYCKSRGFETEIEGRKAFAMNLGNCNSEYFKSVTGYDILMPFCFDGDKWTVSLYSTTIDVSEIAKKYGGGGHKGASGFQCSELPFKKLMRATSPADVHSTGKE